MKTTNQASRKAGKKTASAQSVTAPENTSGEIPKSRIKIRIISELDEINLGDAALPEDLADEIVKRATDEGFRTVGGLVIFSLTKEMRDYKRRGYCPSDEFESTVQTAFALFELLKSKLCGDLEDKANVNCPDYRPDAALQLIGYMRLIDQAQKELLATFTNMFAWLQAKETPDSVQAEGRAQ